MKGWERGLLDGLGEPVLLVGPDSRILDTNKPAQRLLINPIGRDVVEFVTTGPDDFRVYLRRCFGTSANLPGAVVLRCHDGREDRFRVQGTRIAPRANGTGPTVALRLLPTGGDEFSALARQVRALNAEVAARHRAQISLEEALRRNQLLMWELQHRVKNNMQMLLGLIDVTRRERRSPELSELMGDFAQRIRAVAAVHQVMYQASDPHVVDVKVLVQKVSEAVAFSNDPRVPLHVSASEGPLPSDAASPFAIILNELLTNAYKHGALGEDARIEVLLERSESGYTLVVQDNGPGVPEGSRARRASGLGLVRGLCRQIRASLEIENVNGTRATVRLGQSEE